MFSEKSIRKLILGFVLGLLLVFVSYIVGMAAKGIDISLHSIAVLHADEVVYFIIDLLPLFMAVVFFIFYNSCSVNEKKMGSKIQNQEEKTERILHFIKNIGKLEASDLRLLEEDEVDKALLKLNNEIVSNKEAQEKRQKEDEQRNWAASGLAMFGDLLRQNNDNLEELAYQIISNLVKYLGANQGGFFILNEEDPKNKCFEMLACYAYSRKKYTEKTVEWKEGLIGMCALEKNSIYLTEVPEDYVDITSGLGKATPRSLFIVPLKLNDIVYGVLEMASFEELEQYQKDFVEKVSESIASTIASVKINIHTAKLLKDSQEKSKMLSQQEEEMRQNLEELQATQEEVIRQGKEMKRFSNTMNHTLIRAEYDMNGIVVYANMNFLEILGYENNSDIEGQHFSKFIDNKDLPRYEAMWTELIHGGKHHKVDMRHLTKEGKDVWVMSTYACLRDENGDPVKISFIGIDITERRKQDLAYESQINALNNALLKAELSSDGEFVSKNKLFESLFEYDEEQYKSLTIFDFLAAENKDSFIIDWREILEGRPYKSRQKLVTGSGEYKWFQVNYSSTFNLYGELDKVILLATDITEQKRIEEDAHKKAEELKKQEKELRHNIEEMKSIQEKMTANQEKLTLSEKQLKEQVAIVEQEKYKTAQILEGCVEGIISFREDGTVEMYNKAAEDILGFPRSEIIDKNITDFIGLSIVETTNDVEIIYNGPEKIKLNNAKNEIMVKNASGEEVSVLITLNEVITGEEYNFTAFVQNIEVELF